MLNKTVKQLAVFIENRAGRLAEICELLGKNNINILGFSIADTEGYGIFRIIVKDSENAKAILKNGGFTVNDKDVLCVDVPHKPGGLSLVLNMLSTNNINVEYVYAIANTLIIFHVEDNAAAAKVLIENNVKLKSSDDLV